MTNSVRKIAPLAFFTYIFGHNKTMTANNITHVLHIASGDLWAGAEVQLFTLVKKLQATADIKIDVILLNPGRLEQELREIGANVTIIDETRLNSLLILFHLIHLLRQMSPDIVHTHRLKENILGSIAAKLSGHIPCIRTAHGAPEYPSGWRHIHQRLFLLADWFCGRYLQCCIIAVSDDLGEILAKDYPAKKIHVINNGIDVAELEQAALVTAATKTENVSYKIGIAGRLSPVKRVDIFIRTAKLLLAECPELNLSFHIYGDGPLRKELEILNQQLNTSSRVTFEGHCENIHLEVQQLDLLLMTSDHEGLPMVLLEAMALRTPIIAHAVGGIPELLGKGSCGLLVQQQKPENYMEKIQDILNDKNHYLDIVSKAYSRVHEHYSADKNALSYRKIYKQFAS